jgi:hypothetical protein
MRRSEDTLQTSLAWVRALRAAALLLNSEVCRYVMACRADLSPARRGHLQQASRQAWKEAYSLYSQDIWQYFQIDEPELHRRALSLARLRMTGRVSEALEAEREALRRVLSAA